MLVTTDAWHQPQIDLGLDEDGWSGQAHAGVYGQEEVRRYSGVTERQLHTWVTKNLITPSVSNPKGSGTRRLFSFQDIVAFRTLKRLTDAGLALHKLDRAVETLRRLGEADLSSTVLVCDGKTVYQCRSDDEVLDLLRGGQIVFAISISHVLADLRHAGVAAGAVTELAGRRGRGADGRRGRRREIG